MKSVVGVGVGVVAAEVAAPPDWSCLPDDMLLIVMQILDIRDLLSAGAVCSSWRPAYLAIRSIRLPITNASPCILYSRESDDSNTATIYSPSSKMTFKVRLPDPPFRCRHVVGSGHGWIVTADEMSNLQALNPLTGAQVDLPPVTGLYHVESFLDQLGRIMYNHHYDAPGDPDPLVYHPEELRLFLYHRVVMSCSPSAGRQCVVLLIHRPTGQLSFARIGDQRWTRIIGEGDVFDELELHLMDAVYNENDCLFYVVSRYGCIFTLDLNGPLPVARKIFQEVAIDDCTKYIVITPMGSIFQVWRFSQCRLATNPGTYVPNIWDDEDDEFDDKEWITTTMELYKVDIDEQKLVKSTCLEGYALFMGFSSPILVPTQDFLAFGRDCAYFTDDTLESICIHKFGRRDIGMWNFKTATLGHVQPEHSWLNFPPPIWITPFLG
ncbi:uncharacterized protein LOC124690104 [Lolium rigidum]|uniref:uncharacterized protein LOC124690104 n=1 Tax=Lolium rigidum TaxID=89674 RepID=UPI001F5C8468|nr:uncharacterized protein LOC124690104 [Lolium rigidum]